MSESVTIILPLPSAYLSPNCQPGSFGGRMRKAVAAKRYRETARVATLANGIETGPWMKAEVHLKFYHKQARRRDDINSAQMMKSAFDGIVEAGLVFDDDFEHWTTMPVKFSLDKNCSRVEIMIERKA